eukprot:CAMPEP_0195509848 /NCGR_PEP_ID=MMETSP0794_2-20130614/2661_1 /TAXON_ID=515487 /ORGANISM="Stephanopyxis turris, Strain CCMP 815" /LENGTH=589 /DNA_ID=CAMNT_0040637155 /DNA_START=210 /DNA_END=1979 /DNA_ORIENTATION=-
MNDSSGKSKTCGNSFCFRTIIIAGIMGGLYGTSINFRLLQAHMAEDIKKEEEFEEDFIKMITGNEESTIITDGEETVKAPPLDIIEDSTTNDKIVLAKDNPFLLIAERTEKHAAYCPTADPGPPLQIKNMEEYLEKKNTRLSPNDLPVLGASQTIRNTSPAALSQCTLPPPKSCDQETFTVIFMGYKPDRVKKIWGQVQSMSKWKNADNKNAKSKRPGMLVEEIILIWNGEISLNESKDGQALLQASADPEHPLRIFFSSQHGLQNNLLNRYHPDVKPTTDALLYYDDDGPFYSLEAIESAFALWKRHSKAQIGAMGRNFRLDPRMKQTRKDLLEKAGGVGSDEARTTFVPLCRATPPPPQAEETADDVKTDNSTSRRALEALSNTVGDYLEYNYFVFPNFEANMVLPSGSFLHKNYLCFIWHEAFKDIRDFVLGHPVHPDDVTVSTLVTQLSGYAPLVYSRRVNRPKSIRRKLADVDSLPTTPASEESEWDMYERNHAMAWNEQRMDSEHRRLLWDDNDPMVWAKLREEAINSLAGYFGSINSGSVGWCFGTEYHTKNKKGEDDCTPQMASSDKIPWMNKGGFGYEDC